MDTRWWIAGGVFVVGFGVGLGATYALLERKPTAAADAPPEEVPPADDEGSPDKVGANKAGPEAVPPAALPKAAAPDKAVVDLSDGGKLKPADETTPPPQPPQPAPEAPDAGSAAIQAPDTGAAVAEAPDAGLASPPEPGKWWVGLAGKQCRVDLGKAPAVVIRKGEIKDGDVVDWKTAFGSAPRIGAIGKDESVVALVHGVAVDAVGTPTAALITVDRQGTPTTGIIALHTQGLRVSLSPVDAPPPTP